MTSSVKLGVPILMDNSADTVSMLRHMATEIEKAPEGEPPVICAIIIAMRADGGWAAMTSMAVDPMAGVALLEFAKLDLMSGGARWEQFQPAANEPKL